MLRADGSFRSLLCCLTLALAPGEPFLDLTYEQALARAKDEGKLLVADFTATWCPPCKKMEKDTWPAEPVRAWLAEHALAIQIDVDEQSELAGTMKIEAMPTMIVFKDGAELDRVVGFKSAEDLIAWLDGVKAGRRAGDEARTKAESLVGSDDVDARYDVAKDLLRQRDYEAAAKQYLWLWKNTRGLSKYAGVRVSFMLSDIQRLCDAYEPAREAFAQIHNQLDAKLRAQGSIILDDWTEWLALSREFEEDLRVLAYYDDKAGEDGRLPWPGPRGFLADFVDEQMFDVLARHGRYADAGRVLADLEIGARKKLMQFRSIAAMTKMLGGGREDLADLGREQLRDDLSRFHAAALSSGRSDAAATVAGLLLEELDDADSRMALVRTDIAAGRAGPEQAAWLDEAERLGADVAELRSTLVARQADGGATARPGEPVPSR